MKKVITSDDGHKVTTYPTRATFNPLTATTAQLVANGFPAVPNDDHHRQRFAQIWNRIKNKYHYIEPQIRIDKERIHGPRKRLLTDGPETSSNWSGSVVYAPAGQSLTWMLGNWVIPAVTAPVSGEAYDCATWIGFDGDGSPDVLQSGIESAVSPITGASPSYYAWWQWFPGPAYSITNFPVSPGDFISISLCGGGYASTSGSLFLTNITTGASTNISLSAPAGSALAGNSAEWIVEAPTVNGSQTQLPDYGEVFFNNCEAYTSTGLTVKGGTGHTINLGSGNNVVSNGVLIAPDVIQCSYSGAKP